MISRLILVLGGVFAAQTALSDTVGDPIAGRKLAGQCRTCHGIDGKARIPIAPNIGGEPAQYLVAQLTAFRDGIREHEMMSVVAKNLSNENIGHLAAWYASIQAKGALSTGVDPGAAPELCVACHGVTGISEMEEAPNLTAETTMYIDTQLKAFRSGKRAHDIMSLIAEDMSDEDIRAVAEWYANTTLELTIQ